MEKVIRDTYSLCDICGEQIPARLTAAEGRTYLKKSCPKHGDFSALVWKNQINMMTWCGEAKPLAESEISNCPALCREKGLCSDHKNGTCCVLLEVTERCTLKCAYCFANKNNNTDKPLDELIREMKSFVVPGETLVQLSGGEPTMRDDLPQIVSAARELGCKYIQLNSNGIRLAEDENYVKALADAGLSFVFMQFDGVRDEIYEKLRGIPLFAVKERAIDNCAKHGLGVTLVPTVVRGVNSDSLGDILRYGVSRSPDVRGVHFQPVSYMGRIPFLPSDSDRYTLDELMIEIEKQSDGLVKCENLFPSRCDHPMCGFHGDFIVKSDRTLHPLTKKRADAPSCCCGSESPASKNREFVGRRWLRRDNHSSSQNLEDLENMDTFLSSLEKNGFTVTSMAFQDICNIDIERLCKCSLHVARDGRLVPFCANYLTLRYG